MRLQFKVALDMSVGVCTEELHFLEFLTIHNPVINLASISPAS